MTTKAKPKRKPAAAAGAGPEQAPETKLHIPPRIYRTTIRLDEWLLEDARKLAAERHCSLNQLIEEAVRSVVLRAQNHVPGETTKLPTFKGGGWVHPKMYDGKTSISELLDEVEGPLWRGPP